MALDNVESLRHFYPELILIATALGVVLADISLWRARRVLNPALSLIGLSLAFLYALAQLDFPGGTLFHNMVALDRFGVFFKCFFIATAILVLLVSLDSDELAQVHQGEFFALLLTVTLGMILLATSTNLLMLYLSLELVSLTSYIMVGYLKGDRLSNEASLKYLLFGAVATGTMLYGLTFLYGLTGTLDIYRIRDFMNVAMGDLGGLGALVATFIVILLLAGFGFKTAAVPFHFWCPDVYTGAPTPVTAFLSVGPKAAGFAILVRFFFTGMSDVQGGLIAGINWPALLIVISVITMTWGNIAALTQNNLKRMLAYSSIAHAGYILMGVVVLTDQGLKAMLAYLIVYLFMNLGAFLVVIVIYNRERSFEIDDYNGMYKRSPFLTLSMIVFMLSLIGVPPFAGFLAKLYVFAAVIEKGLIWYAIVGALNSVIGLFYYARVIKAMMIEEGKKESPLQISPLSKALLSGLAIPNLLLILFWNDVDRLVAYSLRLFYGS